MLRFNKIGTDDETKYTILPFKVRDIKKLKEKVSLALLFLVVKINKNIQYKFKDKRVDLLLIGEGEKSTMPLKKILTHYA